jgi:hypothetical protein
MVDHWWMVVWMSNAFIAGHLKAKPNKGGVDSFLLWLNIVAAMGGAILMFIEGVAH